jgi:hypothetical protein
LPVSSDNTLEDDILWVYHKLPSIKNQDDIERVKDAPSPGAIALLSYAYKYQKDFFTRHLEKALKKKEQEGTLTDDRRRQFDLLDQIDEQLVEEWNAKRQCPFCLQSLKRATFLLPRSERAREESVLPEEAPGSGSGEP